MSQTIQNSQNKPFSQGYPAIGSPTPGSCASQPVLHEAMPTDVNHVVNSQVEPAVNPVVVISQTDQQMPLQNSQTSQQSEINFPVNRDSQPGLPDDSQYDQLKFGTQQLSQGSDRTDKSNSQQPLQTTIVGTQVGSQLDGSQSVKSQPVEQQPLQSQSVTSQADGSQLRSVKSQSVGATQSAENK